MLEGNGFLACCSIFKKRRGTMKKTALILFRENDLFNGNLQHIVAGIQKAGFEEVLTSSISRETPDDMIAKAISISGNFNMLFADTTCENAFKEIGCPVVNLDNLFSKTVENLFCVGDSGVPGFQKTLQSILNMIVVRPKKLVIVQDKILAHNPFFDHEYTPEKEFAVAEIVKAVFEKSGFVNIEITSEHTAPDEEGVWIVIDRHCQREFSQAFCCHLPVESSYVDLKHLLIIHPNNAEWVSALEENIFKSIYKPYRLVRYPFCNKPSIGIAY